VGLARQPNEPSDFRKWSCSSIPVRAIPVQGSELLHAFYLALSLHRTVVAVR